MEELCSLIASGMRPLSSNAIEVSEIKLAERYDGVREFQLLILDGSPSTQVAKQRSYWPQD